MKMEFVQNAMKDITLPMIGHAENYPKTVLKPIVEVSAYNVNKVLLLLMANA